MVLRGLCDILACGLLFELIHGKIQTTLTRYKLSRQVFALHCALVIPHTQKEKETNSMAEDIKFHTLTKARLLLCV